MVAENVRMPEIICNREKVPRMFMMFCVMMLCRIELLFSVWANHSVAIICSTVHVLPFTLVSSC